jgi:glycosyltransferase involved in cell wall biosynthesis
MDVNHKVGSQPMESIVSIIITAYNSGPELLAALQSAHAQTWPTKEVIVVDDGSESSKADWIKEACNTFPDTQLIRQSNQGLSAARNFGAEAALGDFLSFLDHDDVWQLEFLEKTLLPLQSNTHLGATFCCIEHMTHGGSPTGKKSRPKLLGLTIQDFLISDPVCCGSSFVVRRQTFKEVGGFDSEMKRAETPDFFIRMLAINWGIEGIPEALVLYRNTPGSLSSGKLLANYRESLLRKAFRENPSIGSVKFIQWQMKLNQARIQLRRLLRP